MSRREQLLKRYLLNSNEAANLLKANGFHKLESDYIWQILIYELEHHDIPSAVLLHDLSSQEIASIIENYISENGSPVDTITIEQPIATNYSEEQLIKAYVKSSGEVWVIHRNDKDTFPSQPHAHNYDKQLKLHLGTGGLFRKKVIMGSINNKELITIRSLIEAKIKDINLPDLAC
jgi:hypothetical protein